MDQPQKGYNYAISSSSADQHHLRPWAEGDGGWVVGAWWSTSDEGGWGVAGCLSTLDEGGWPVGGGGFRCALEECRMGFLGRGFNSAHDEGGCWRL